MTYQPFKAGDTVRSFGRLYTVKDASPVYVTMFKAHTYQVLVIVDRQGHSYREWSDNCERVQQ